MKYLFFVENNHSGGMDSFFINLINFWPRDDDELWLVANRKHPGISTISKSITRDCKIIAHRMPINWQMADDYFGGLPRSLQRIIRITLRYMLIPFQFFYLRSFFQKDNYHRLLVVNGAYPGGETCRVASMAWNSLGRTSCVHNIRNFAERSNIIVRPLENYLDRRLLASVSQFIGVSRSCAESLRTRPEFSKTTKIGYIYNGVKVGRDDSKSKTTLDIRKRIDKPNAKICLMLATYEPRKGHDFVIKAFERVIKKNIDAHLVCFGDSVHSEKMLVNKARNDSLARDNIHLFDFVTNGKNIINQADILLVGSQSWESFGWTVIEAMARSVPVVATNVDGLNEVTGPNSVTSYSVPPHDVEGFASAIDTLLNDASIKSEMTKKAVERVEKLFTVERMVNEYYSALNG